MAKVKSIDFSKGVRGLHFGKQLKFQCAPTDLIAQLEPLAREFFSEVLVSPAEFG